MPQQLRLIARRRIHSSDDLDLSPHAQELYAAIVEAAADRPAE